MVTAAWAGAANPIVKPASAVAAAAPPATRRAKAPPLVLIMLCPPWTHAGTRRARHPDHPPWRPVETQFYRTTAPAVLTPRQMGAAARPRRPVVRRPWQGPACGPAGRRGAPSRP